MLTRSSRALGQWLLATGLVGTAIAGACAEPKGAIMLAINTDMRAPKDVNAVSVSISTNGAIKHSFIGRVTPQGDVLLPATLAITEPEDKSASIRIRVMAFQDRKPRVLRDIRTTVPTGGRTALLRIPLNFVNDASAVGEQLPPGVVPDAVPGTGGTPTGGAGGGDGGGQGVADFDFFGSFQPPCDDIQNQTIIDGECKDSFVDAESLPDFTSEEEQLGNSTVVGSCFELARCFAISASVDGPALDGSAPAIPQPPPEAGAGSAPDPDAGGDGGKAGFKSFGLRPSAVVLDRNTCVLDLGGADPARLNLALVTPETGECVRPGECYVPIDRGPAGWKDENGRVQLPRFVCALLDKKNLRLATSTDVCAAKLDSNPICTPKVGEVLPNADPDAATPADAAAVPIADASIADAAADVSLPDAAPPPGQIVAESFASTIGGRSNHNRMVFAGASRVATIDLTALKNGAAFTTTLPIPAAALPWKASPFRPLDFGITNGTATAYYAAVQGPFAVKPPITLAAGANDVGTSGSADSIAWAVGPDGAGPGGLYRSSVVTTEAAVKLTTPVVNATAVVGIDWDIEPDTVFVGERSGVIRACTIGTEACSPAHNPGGGRVDAFALMPDTQGIAYALLSDGLYRISIINTLTREVQSTRFAASTTTGVTKDTLYYPRSLAAPRGTASDCIFFTSTNGVEYVRPDGTGGAVLVTAAPGKPILGLAVGLGYDPTPGGNYLIAVYYTVFAAAADGGGVYAAAMPAACRSGGAPTCNSATCPTGCCAGGACTMAAAQGFGQCGQGGAACQSCMGVQTCVDQGNGGQCL